MSRRQAWIAVAVVVIVAGAGLAVWRVAGSSTAQGGVLDNADPTGIAKVSRRTLSSQSQVTATLGYAGAFTVVNQTGGSSSGAGGAAGAGGGAGGGGTGSSGTYTSLPWVGKKIRQGRTIYGVDGQPVLMLYGRVPAYRSLSEGMTGADVEQLNTDLVALGYATRSEIEPASDAFTWQTAVALERLQARLGETETGTLALGAAVFLPGAIRVTAVDVTLGSSADAGSPVLTATSTRRLVTIALDPSQQSEVRVGDRVDITLPDNRITPGVVTSVGTVASTAPSSSGSADSGGSAGADGGGDSGSGSPTINVLVRPLHPARTGSWDQASIEVTITNAKAKNVLAVPVDALLALEGGGYGIEEVSPGGVHSLVRVTLGLFDNAAGLVQVSGSGLAAGQRVVVPAL